MSFPLCWQRARWASFRLRENFDVLAPSAVSVVNLFSLFLFFFPFYFTETQAPAIPAQSSTCCRFILFYSQLDLLCFVFCVVISSREGVLCRAVVCLSSLCVTLLQDVMEKVRSDSLLDMNLEKSRVKELVSYVNLENYYFYEVL